MISRCYLEITNVCNLDCVFCPKTNRAKHRLTLSEFDELTDKLQSKIKFLYFHLMGEPTVHPLLPDFIQITRQKGMIPVLTTNGTLLNSKTNLLNARPHKIQISLHSHEGNRLDNLEQYITNIMEFAKRAAAQGTIIVLRLWNQGGYDKTNEQVLKLISQYQPQPWIERHDGWRLASNLYLEYDRMFKWPDSHQAAHEEKNIFCYALRNQIGVLVDGSVVPCCLDHAGDIILGNLYEQSLDEIIYSSRAQTIYNGFTNHTAVEPLCQRCGYATTTKQYRK